MFVAINEFLIPFFFNGDSDNLSEDEINAVVKFQEKYGDCFDVLTYKNSDEWLTDFAKCELTGVMSKVVWLYNTEEDKRYLEGMYLMNEKEEYSEE